MKNISHKSSYLSQRKRRIRLKIRKLSILVEKQNNMKNYIL